VHKVCFLTIASSFFQKKSAKPDVDVKEIRAVEAEDLVRSLISVAYCLWLFM
jgi:hypothetical protein